jgi:hypothetical protein
VASLCFDSYKFDYSPVFPTGFPEVDQLGMSCTIPSIMTIFRNEEANEFFEPKGPRIIRLFPVRRVPSTTSSIARSAVRLTLVFSALLVCFAPLAGQQTQPVNSATSSSQAPAANPNTSVIRNASASQGDADRIEEIAHRIRLLEIKASEKSDKWYMTILLPLATTIIGSLVVLLSAWVGRAGQESAAKAAANANATLARNAAADAKQMAKDAALFKHAEQMMEFKQKQIQEFYGPLYAALRQSRSLYDKLLDQLVYDDSAQYQRTPNATGDDYRLQVLDKAGQWKDFRLVDQLPALKSNPRAMALVDAIIGLGKNMCEIIATRAGYAAEDSVDLLGLYTAHHAILTAIRNGPETEAFQPGRHKVGAFPYGLDKVIGDKYHELSNAIDQYGQAYDRALHLLAEKTT